MSSTDLHSVKGHLDGPAKAGHFSSADAMISFSSLMLLNGQSSANAGHLLGKSASMGPLVGALTGLEGRSGTVNARAGGKPSPGVAAKVPIRILVGIPRIP